MSQVALPFSQPAVTNTNTNGYSIWSQPRFALELYGKAAKFEKCTPSQPAVATAPAIHVWYRLQTID